VEPLFDVRFQRFEKVLYWRVEAGEFEVVIMALPRRPARPEQIHGLKTGPLAHLLKALREG